MKQLIIIIILFCKLSHAQQDYNNSALVNQINQETVSITPNSNFFLTGEYLFYSVFAKELNQKSSISQIAYVKLLDHMNEVVFSHKLKLTNASVVSDYFISTDLLTGNYKLIAYTNWSLNNSEKAVDIADIYIFNPYKSDFKKNKFLKDTTRLQKNTNSLNFIDSKNIKISKTAYKTRDLVEFEISGYSNFSSDFIISIKKVEEFKLENKINPSKISKNTSNILLPEMRGQIISGTLTNLEDLSVHNKNISLSIPDAQHYAFKIAHTNNKGEFNFILENNNQNSETIFQYLDENPTSYRISIDNEPSLNYSKLNYNFLNIDSKLNPVLKQIAVENQIENAYFEKKQDTTYVKNDNNIIYGKQGITYKLNDYTRFKSLKETFVEIIKTAAIRKIDNQLKLIVSTEFTENSQVKLSNLEPLILVDGLTITNHEDIINFNPKNINSITTVSGKYLFGNKLFEGIIDFRTFDSNFAQNFRLGEHSTIVNIKTLRPEKTYYSPDYTNSSHKTIPDYRRQLLWKLVSKNETKKVHKIYTSDVKGLFEIKLIGFNKNGEVINETSYFTVN